MRQPTISFEEIVDLQLALLDVVQTMMKDVDEDVFPNRLILNRKDP